MRWSQIAWFAALAVISIATVTPSSGPVVDVQHGDKVLHVAAYFGLGLLGGIGWPHRRWWLLLSLPLFGMMMEVIQGALVPGRVFDWGDGIANLAGAVAGVAASILATRVLLQRA